MNVELIGRLAKLLMAVTMKGTNLLGYDDV
jgi:hypothetical protein